MQMRSRLSPVALACVLALSACNAPKPPANESTTPAAAATPPKAAEAAPSATQDFPTLAIDTVDGKRFDLAQHRGKWVVVNFWATWCSPCLKEMPALSALDTMREHIDVVGLAYEDTTLKEMQAFLKKHPVSYPIALVDVYSPPKDFETPAGLPTTWLIAPDGKVTKRFIGPVEVHDIEAAIAAAGGPKPGAG
ncbi:redoxin family protein [Lysobacter sp. KIS68-7]|uniref:TlpA family protein disulfide reductase n=1 Tax=Lysobacter sp. KIS68-7 TaxID=2904252 RepID=UPI0031B9D995